jgi:hypothetical protein
VTQGDGRRRLGQCETLFFIQPFVRRIFLTAAVVVMTGCDRAPWLPVPDQRPSFEGFRLHGARVVDMSDPDVDAHIVRDIGPPADPRWRWTQSHPTLRIRVEGVEPLLYSIDFTLAESTFPNTGPVTLTFLVNDHVLDRVRYSESGHHYFEKPVPREWIPPDQVAIVAAEIDKLWRSPNDGATYGFILTRMGLTAAESKK